MTDPTTPKLAVREAAAAWLLQRAEPDWSPSDEVAFQTWLQADAAHAQAFARLQATWQQVGATPQAHAHAATVTARAQVNHDVGRAPDRRRMRWQPRRWLASLALAGAACSALLWWAPGALTPSAPSLAQGQTAWDETRTLALPDGSVIDVNRGTAWRTDYDGQQRQVTLLHGEAFFAVTPDPAQPFVVDVGEARITVIGTAFNVLTAPAFTRIEVSEGVVQVQPTAGATPVRLTAGESLLLAAGQAGLRTRALQAGSWREGRLVLRDTSLGELAWLLSRYRAQPVTVAPEVAALTVSGVVKTAQPEAFLVALPRLTQVRLEPRPDGGVHLRAR